MPMRVALLATATFILGALAGIASVFIASDPGGELETLQVENRALHQRIDALERQLAEPAEPSEGLRRAMAKEGFIHNGRRVIYGSHPRRLKVRALVMPVAPSITSLTGSLLPLVVGWSRSYSGQTDLRAFHVRRSACHFSAACSTVSTEVAASAWALGW